MNSEQPKVSRDYAQGAQGEKQAVVTHKVSVVDRIRYTFDNLISNTRSFVIMLTLATALFANLIAVLSYLNGDDPGQDPRWRDAEGADRPYDARAWLTFAMLVLPVGKPMGSMLDRYLAVILQVGTLIFTALVIAFVTSKILEITNRIKLGKSSIIDVNHTLILGWSNRVFPILIELNAANRGLPRIPVVLYSHVTRAEMETEIAKRCGELKSLRVVTRTGDINNPDELVRANVQKAKSVILLDDAKGADANIVSAVLAIQAAAPGTNVKVIAEVEDPHISRALKAGTAGNVISVRSDDVIARVTAQASRQPGLAAVVLDMIDFVGAEIYFKRVPALDDCTYAEALLAFDNSSVIGYVDGNSVTHLNPAPSTKLGANSKIIAVAEDSNSVVYTGVREELASLPVSKSKPLISKPSSLLVIGWSYMGAAVLHELAEFLPKGSTVDIAVLEKFVSKEELKGLDFGNIKVSSTVFKREIEDLTAIASKKKYSEVIVLGYRKKIDEAEADAHTLLAMLQLDKVVHDESVADRPRLIAEILDSRKAELARVAANGDLVISDKLAALLIAQLGSNPGLAPVFDDLFGAKGATIQLRPIEQYAQLGKPVEFAELVVSARNFAESAIGYRQAINANQDGSTGSEVNPAKSTVYTPSAGDSLIVIGTL